jgi:hypothetical protein
MLWARHVCDREKRRMGRKSVSKICFCLDMVCFYGAGVGGVERENVKCGTAGAGGEMKERGRE